MSIGVLAVVIVVKLDGQLSVSYILDVVILFCCAAAAELLRSGVSESAWCRWFVVLTG